MFHSISKLFLERDRGNGNGSVEPFAPRHEWVELQIEIAQNQNHF